MVEVGGLTRRLTWCRSGLALLRAHEASGQRASWCEARPNGGVCLGLVGCGPAGRHDVRSSVPTTSDDVPLGHDGYTIGDEPCVLIEWSGMRALAGARGEFHDRVLATLLFTDIVESTAKLSRAVTRPGATHSLCRHGRAGRPRAIQRTRDRPRGRRRLREVRPLPARFAARLRSGPVPRREGCTSAAACTPARSLSQAIRCAGSPSTKRRGSWRSRRQGRYWSRRRRVRSSRASASPSRTVGEHELKGLPEPRGLRHVEA